MGQPSSPASSPSRPVVPWVSLVSSTKAPSRIEISRSAVAATRESWVTITQRLPGRAQAVEQPEHVQGRGAVEVAGRLVGEHDERLVAERAGDRDPLTLAARERRGQMLGAVGEPDLLQQLRGPASRRARRAPGQQRGQLDVLHRGELVHQVEGLEDEADRAGGAAGPAPSRSAGRCGARPATPPRPTGAPGRPAGAAASTCRSRSAPSRPASRPRPPPARRASSARTRPSPWPYSLLQPARAHDRPRARWRLVGVHHRPFVAVQ